MNVKFTIFFICFYLFTDEGLYEGDMVLDPDQLQEVAEGKFTFASTASKNKLWPNNEVPYSIDYALGKFSYLFKLFIFCFSQTALLTSHLHQASISTTGADLDEVRHNNTEENENFYIKGIKGSLTELK